MPKIDLSKKSFLLSRLAQQANKKRDRECLFRLAKEVAIIDQDFETAMVLREMQNLNQPLRKGGRHAAQR